MFSRKLSTVYKAMQHIFLIRIHEKTPQQNKFKVFDINFTLLTKHRVFCNSLKY